MEYVILECVKIGSKLRVRIKTPGYYNEANCQFPKNLREIGTKYTVAPSEIRLITTRGKYFYSIKKVLKIYKPGEVIEQPKIDLSKITLYEDKNDEDCVICMCEKKNCVILPCGHFYTCMGCSEKVDKCPMCRVKITLKINKDQMD